MAKYWLLMPQMAWFSRVRALPSVKNLAGGVIALSSYLFSGIVYAADLQTVLTNVSSIIVPLTAMVLMISFCAGIFMIISALGMMKKFGQAATMQSQPGELSGPFMKLIIGAILVYLPTSTDTLMNSIFSTGSSIFGGGSVNYQNMGAGSSLLGYVGGDTLGQQWASLANTLVLYIQFIGLLSFIKGWFLLSKSVGMHAQQGNVGKGITHVIGGIVAINFVGAVNIINNTILGS